MDLYLRKLRTRLRQKLKINSPYLELVLEEAIAHLARMNAIGYELSAEIIRAGERYFDRFLIEKIQSENTDWTTQIHLKNYLKERLTQQFSPIASAKFITTAFQNCLTSFLQKLSKETDFFLKDTQSVAYRFQYAWDQRLLLLIRSEKMVERTYASDYYYHYLRELATVKNVETQLRLTFSGKTTTEYTTPFQEAFTQFIQKITNRDFVFKQNATAFFIIIFKNKVTDFKRKLLSGKTKNEPSRPTNLDLTNPSEADYVVIEQQLKPLQTPYLPYLPKGLTLLKERCRSVLKLYFFAKQNISEIAEDEGVAKQTIHERLHKCRKKLGEILEKLKEQDG